MLTKKLNLNLRRALPALAAVMLIAAPTASGADNPAFPAPSPEFSEREIREFSVLCQEAGHDTIVLSQQYYGSEYCQPYIRACRFSEDGNPTGGKDAGCMYTYGTYNSRANSYRFGNLFRGKDCLARNHLRGEENTWDICAKVIPACEGEQAPILNGEPTENPFAPCANRRDPSVNLQNRAGRTKLHLAIREGRYNEIDGLLSAGADPNIQDRRGETALHYAATTGTHAKAVMSRLLEAGADPAIESRRGETALHVAAAASAAAVRVLLEAGADPRVRNRRDQTPLQIAEARGQEQAATLLIQATR